MISPGAGEVEEALARLREAQRIAQAWAGRNEDASAVLSELEPAFHVLRDLTEAADALSERSVLVEAAEEFQKRHDYAERMAARYSGLTPEGRTFEEGCRVAYEEALDYLRSLTVSQEGECKRCGGEQIIAVDIPGGHARTVQPCPDCKDQGDGEVAVRLSLTADEQAALRHEFSEPYGRDMRLGIIGKLRTALEEEGR